MVTMDTYQQRREEMVTKGLKSWEIMNAGVAGKPLEKVIWTDVTKIIEVLDYIGKHQAPNHTFMPSGGGLDLVGAHISHESGLVELNFDGSPKLVKPESLTFYAIGDNPEWWYFRLETSKFSPTKVYDYYKDAEDSELIAWSQEKQIEWSMQFSGEELLEVSPGNYMDRSYWEAYNLGEDENGYTIPLPPEARVITRKFNGGAFVIFSKFSLYNSVPSTYDARHNRMNDKEFRQYVEAIVEKLESGSD